MNAHPAPDLLFALYEARRSFEIIAVMAHAPSADPVAGYVLGMIAAKAEGAMMVAQMNLLAMPGGAEFIADMEGDA